MNNTQSKWEDFMRLRVIVAALLGGLAILSSTIAASAKDELKPRKLGVIIITLQSESLARWTAHIQAAAAKLKWQVIVKDGVNNPAVLATALPELLNEGVDAVLTMAVDATLISEGLAAAKAKNVPVIATAVDVNPAGKSLFSAVYAPDSYGLGVSLADYLLKKDPKAIAVGQTVTIVYGADRLVVGAKETLQKKGGSMEAVVDADVTNLVNSFTQTTTDLALAHPKATALISCCDFSPLIDLPALKSANRPDMLLLTRYDNESSLQAIRAGAPLVIATNHTDIFNFEALDALASYFTKKTPVPASVDESKSEIKVIDKSNVPASGFVYSFDKDLATYADRWSTLYQY
jgi:ABC-type sugar transport system substrate-binding protein